MTVAFDAIVLAGGRGSRLGGVDKAALELGGERLVARVVAATREAGADRVVVVGPGSAAVPDATLVREDPPFSGPLPALAAGLDALLASPPTIPVPSNTTNRCLTPPNPTNLGVGRTSSRAAHHESLPHAARPNESWHRKPSEWVVLLACDLVDPTAVCRALLTALTGATARDHDGVVLRDPDGRTQWLASIVRAAALRNGIAALRAECAGTDPLTNKPLRLAFSRARLAEIPAPHATTADIDTPDDLTSAQQEGAS